MIRIIKSFSVLLVLFLIFGIQPVSPVVTLALTGDMMLGRGIAIVHQNRNWESALAFISPYSSEADLALANLESPITISPVTEKTLKYDLHAHPESLQALTDAGFDLLSIVNNHALDYGEAGRQETQADLEEKGLASINTDKQPYRISIKGINMAFLAFEDVNQPLDIQSTKQMIKKASENGDVVIVSIHWGVEYQAIPSQRQRILAQEFVNAGAMLVWGHHPHVLQPVAWLFRQPQGAQSHLSGAKPSLVLYSLGNALFDQYMLPETCRSALLLVTLSADGVKSIQIVPFIIDPRLGKVVVSDAETKKWIVQRLALDNTQAHP